MRCYRERSRRAGFTLVEVTISSGIFLVIAYALAGAVDMGTGSTRTVMEITSQNAELRTSARSMVDELKTTTENQLSVAVLADGNHQVDFRVPILDGADFDWGAFDRSWGPNAADQNQLDWMLRYTVVQVGDERDLVRQVLDEAGDVQEQETLATGLRRGDGANPGFQLNQVGDMWQLTVTTEGKTEGSLGRRTDVHLRLRN